jgi:hypothetical protein
VIAGVGSVESGWIWASDRSNTTDLGS